MTLKVEGFGELARLWAEREAASQAIMADYMAMMMEMAEAELAPQRPKLTLIRGGKYDG